jgi:sugar/nucleoside kinase (ribokinase family)
MKLTPAAMLDYLKGRGRIGGVTLGERGLLWYDEAGDVRSEPALKVPMTRVIDTSGAGDVLHGAYIYSYLAEPEKSWDQHFGFAQAAAAHKIQHLGNEAGLPSLADISRVRREFRHAALAVVRG